jgi:hypothetical protein
VGFCTTGAGNSDDCSADNHNKTPMASTTIAPTMLPVHFVVICLVPAHMHSNFIPVGGHDWKVTNAVSPSTVTRVVGDCQC